jgi:YjbE family integral membrane protein
MFYWLFLLGSIIFLDVCLSGDNAVVIAMAANGLPEKQRDSAISGGMVLACAVRIVLALFATFLLANHWVAFFGGLGLLYVGYKLFLQIRSGEVGPAEMKPATSYGDALLLIMLADITMSLDNVLAVAALARSHWLLMILGITASIVFLTYAAKWVAKLLEKYHWINWVGLVMILWVALDLISGSYDITLNTIRGG